MDTHFDCTLCGRCCRQTKVPLTAGEAVDWLNDGNPVQIICEAAPWPEEPAAANARAAHFKRRSFAAMSGAMPVRVVAILAADIPGDCPNLLPDQRCAIYARRPLVCRIYPAEINPFVALQPSQKACPPEAWEAHRPLMMRDGVLMSDPLRAAIQRSRDADAVEAGLKGVLCALLNIGDAALVREGFAVYSPAVDELLRALILARTGRGRNVMPAPWRIVTDRPETARELARQGAVAVDPTSPGATACRYVGFKAAPAVPI